MQRIISLIWVGFFLQCSNLFAAGQEEIRTLVHTLDYISHDYGHAIKDGKITDAEEYHEMKEFSEALLTQANKIIPHDTLTILELKKLQELIAAKAEKEIVSKAANLLSQKLATEYKLSVSPQIYPDILNGEKVYTTACARCHGEKGHGDGADGKGLSPAPRNFHDDEKMRTLSAFTVFNTVRLGIQGTGMVANPELTDKEVWDVAFYVLSLRYANQKKVRNEDAPNLKLEELATISDDDLALRGWQTNQIAALRLKRTNSDKHNFIATANDLLQRSVEAYENADYSEAERLALAAYLEGIEPLELQLKQADEEVAEAVEKNFLEFRQKISGRAATEEVKSAAEKAAFSLQQATYVLQNTKTSFWVAFSLTLLVLIREGVEAFLIIMVLLAVLQKAGLSNRKKFIHIGWIAAIVFGLILWSA
ncbi:MAG: c-type cytochrome, partial [Chitinophagales bacterium]|nr:c-type cytochrome [Chitinophagales bacterium]